MKSLIIADRIQQAKYDRRPVVALESTVITHGMPYPESIKTAFETENIIEREGAVPATIAILEGKIKVGLSRQEIEELAARKGVEKVSRRDLPWAVAAGKYGSTTVAATMVAAHRAGLRFFATGGIGGVHRGGENSFDISADLTELGRTPVTVVSAGAKAVLDLELTLEKLETEGVPVLGFQTDEFPAFYSRESGLKLKTRVDTPQDIAEIVRTRDDLKLENGILVANPISQEREIPLTEIEPEIKKAVAEARDEEISGFALTPFLLDRIKTISSGQSLRVNIELLKNNARLGARIAIAHQHLEVMGE